MSILAEFERSIHNQQKRIDQLNEALTEKDAEIRRLKEKIAKLQTQPQVLSARAPDPDSYLKNAQVSRQSEKSTQASPQLTFFHNDQIKLKSYIISQLKFKITHQELPEHSEDRFIIGHRPTHLALKNISSYMIATWGAGIKVVEDNKLIFSGEFRLRRGSLQDMVYVSHLNAYFMDHNRKLYRKDIDGNPPYLYMDLVCGFREGACFRYSELNQRLIVCKDDTNISAVDLDQKSVDIELTQNDKDVIKDFRLIGDQENKVVAITSSGFLYLYIFFYTNKIGFILDHAKLEVDRQRLEGGISLAVCKKSEYVLVQLDGYKTRCNCSKLVMYRILNDKLILEATFDVFSKEISTSYALEFYRYIQGKILWVGLTFEKDGVAQMVCYDPEVKELKELEGKWVCHQETEPARLHRLGKLFYYVGKKGKIMKIEFTL